MRFEIEDDEKGVRLHIYYSGLSLKEIIKAFMAPYDEKIMDELINSSQFPLKDRKAYERKSFIAKRIYRGRLVVRGAYKIYLENRERFLNNSDQSNKESEVQ
jgi:hypothetical protein